MISEQFNKVILFESESSKQYLNKDEFLYILSEYPQLSYFIT